MIKSFLISTIFPIFLFSSQQILLVVADDFNTSSASLEFFQDKKIIFTTKVNIGKNGLGWGIGEKKLKMLPDEPRKHEGDMKAPAGVFALRDTFGYSYAHTSHLPYLYADKNLICVDDASSPFYNQIIMKTGREKSFEFMRREDTQYKYGISVAHNREGEYKRGSCIFLHIEKYEGAPTAGCTSMKESALLIIFSLLDSRKNPILIQISKRSKEEIKRAYPELKNSKLLL